MGMSERQRAIIEVLKSCKHETIRNLAFEFGVSARTIRRDIDALSVTEPISTKPGCHGGVSYLGKKQLPTPYMSEEEINVLYKISDLVHNQQEILTDEEVHIFDGIIKKYKRPT